MKRPWIINALRAMRPKQWTKNAVVFAAFIFALGDRQQHIDLSSFWLVLQAAITFCMVSSSVYLLNDIKDVEQDRLHPNKKLRPIAAGELSVPAALGMAGVLAVAGLSWAWKLSPSLLGVVGGYYLLQIVYTAGLKKVALVDIFVIAAGFVLRALAGAVVLEGVIISPWLLLCTMLLALFLALCKRRHEKVILSDLGTGTRQSLEKYNQQLLDQLIAIVSAATIVSYSLYTLWPDTAEKFQTTKLGFTIPFVIFGIFRYLDLVYRHEKGDRPEHILVTDIPLLVDLFLYGLTVFLVLEFGASS